MGWPIALSLLPGTLLFGIFFLIPLGVVAVTSFSQWSVLGFRFVGLANYRELIHDSVFWKAATNTALYAAAGVFIQMPLAVIVALILDSAGPGLAHLSRNPLHPGRHLRRGVRIDFRELLRRDLRPAQPSARRASVIHGRDWLFNIHTALPAIIATYVFGVGFFMILVMTEITAIPIELSEAAEVDGASRLQRQAYIISAAASARDRDLCPAFAALVPSSFFDIVFILTGGGPDNATLTLTVYAYPQYTSDQWGYANAIGVFIVATGFL